MVAYTDSFHVAVYLTSDGKRSQHHEDVRIFYNLSADFRHLFSYLPCLILGRKPGLDIDTPSPPVMTFGDRTGAGTNFSNLLRNLTSASTLTTEPDKATSTFMRLLL
jgi:hypothetical protein